MRKRFYFQKFLDFRIGEKKGIVNIQIYIYIGFGYLYMYIYKYKFIRIYICLFKILDGYLEIKKVKL